MEWNYSTFMWVLLMVIIPGSAFLINVAFRYNKGIPLSSGSDLILLLIVYATCVTADPAMLQGIVSPEFKDKVVPIHLTFLIASVLSWYLSVDFIEKRLNEHYQSVLLDGTVEAEFPYFSWFVTWTLSLVIIVIYLFVIRS